MYPFRWIWLFDLSCVCWFNLNKILIPVVQFAFKMTSGDSWIQDPMGQKYEIEKIGYARNHIIFHLRPVPFKNIEKWGRRIEWTKFSIVFFFRKWEIPYLDTKLQKKYYYNTVKRIGTTQCKRNLRLKLRRLAYLGVGKHQTAGSPTFSTSMGSIFDECSALASKLSITFLLQIYQDIISLFFPLQGLN